MMIIMYHVWQCTDDGIFSGSARMSSATKLVAPQLSAATSPNKPMPPPRPLRSRSSVVRQQLGTVDELRQENKLLKTVRGNSWFYSIWKYFYFDFDFLFSTIAINSLNIFICNAHYEIIDVWYQFQF